MMSKEAYDQLMNASQPHHKASLTHEIIAAAAAYEAMKAWNEHQRKHGQEVNHAMAKQFLAAASAAFIDYMIETKGLDAFDRARMKRAAEDHHDNHLRQYGHHGHHHHHHHGYHHHS